MRFGVVVIIMLLMPLVNLVILLLYKKIPFLASYMPNNIADLGNIYGVSTSFFSGLAFLGLMYVMQKDHKNRDKKEKPFPYIFGPKTSCFFSGPLDNLNNDKCTIGFDFTLLNHSKDIALNVRHQVEVKIENGSFFSESIPSYLPLLSDELVLKGIEFSSYDTSPEKSEFKRHVLIDSIFKGKIKVIVRVFYNNINNIERSSNFYFTPVFNEEFLKRITPLKNQDVMDVSKILPMTRYVFALKLDRFEYQDSED